MFSDSIHPEERAEAQERRWRKTLEFVVKRRCTPGKDLKRVTRL